MEPGFKREPMWPWVWYVFVGLWQEVKIYQRDLLQDVPELGGALLFWGQKNKNSYFATLNIQQVPLYSLQC